MPPPRKESTETSKPTVQVNLAFRVFGCVCVCTLQTVDLQVLPFRAKEEREDTADEDTLRECKVEGFQRKVINREPEPENRFHKFKLQVSRSLSHRIADASPRAPPRVEHLQRTSSVLSDRPLRNRPVAHRCVNEHYTRTRKL